MSDSTLPVTPVIVIAAGCGHPISADAKRSIHISGNKDFSIKFSIYDSVREGCGPVFVGMASVKLEDMQDLLDRTQDLVNMMKSREEDYFARKKVVDNVYVAFTETLKKAHITEDEFNQLISETRELMGFEEDSDYEDDYEKDLEEEDEDEDENDA